MNKKIYIITGTITILIIVAFWHKNYISKTVPETPADNSITTEPTPVTSEPVITKPEPQKETMCAKEQRGADFCVQVYAPVCAEVQIQCITTPCNPIKETFSNSCEACKNQLVSSYTAGECK